MIERSKKLKCFSPVSIGGKAEYFAFVENVEMLIELIKWAYRNKLNVRVFGCASNILFGYNLEGLILKIGIDYICQEGNFIYAGAGTPLHKIIKFAVNKRLEGIEALIGIPGSLGGAIKNNASTYWGQISDVIVKVEAIDKRGRIYKLAKKDIKFYYRGSDIDGLVIIGAQLKLYPCREAKIRRKIEKILQFRKATQPLDRKTLGSVFKNPSSKLKSASLIEKAGFKGKQVGGVRVSNKHANFFEVDRESRFEDFYSLLLWVKSIIKFKYNVNLEPEIEIWKY